MKTLARLAAVFGICLTLLFAVQPPVALAVTASECNKTYPGSVPSADDANKCTCPPLTHLDTDEQTHKMMCKLDLPDAKFFHFGFPSLDGGLETILSFVTWGLGFWGLWILLLVLKQLFSIGHQLVTGQKTAKDVLKLVGDLGLGLFLAVGTVTGLTYNTLLWMVQTLSRMWGAHGSP